MNADIDIPAAPAKSKALPKPKAAAPKANGVKKAAPAKKVTAGKDRQSQRYAPYKLKPKPASRVKKDESPADSVATNKRKKEDEESELSEPEPAPKAKKARVIKEAKAPAAPTKPGPVRGKDGKKKEINALRYTQPLKVFVFGEGGSGELGLGATKKAIDVKRPRYNEALSNHEVVRIATGGMHVVALTKGNRILTWGVNDNGALGRDTSGAEVKMKDMDANDSDSESDDETGGLNEKEATPTEISMEHFPEDTVFVEVAAGDSCSFALTTEGAVYGWGTFRKNEGVLGFTKEVNTARFPIYISQLQNATDIVCGTNHVLALDNKGQVYAWGSGQQNQLGRRVIERNLSEALQPTHLGFNDNSIKGKKSKKMVKIFSGDYHAMAIADDGHVWAWGANNYCETGFKGNAGEDDAVVISPKIVHSLEGKNVQHIACGSHHNVAVTASGELLAWGRCDSAQTGIPAATLNEITETETVLKGANGKAKILLEPTPIPGLDGVVFAACGPDHTIVMNKDGHAYSWGFSANYQTGLGTDDDVLLPTRIENTAVKEEKLVWAGAGGQYSMLAAKKADS